MSQEPKSTVTFYQEGSGVTTLYFRGSGHPKRANSCRHHLKKTNNQWYNAADHKASNEEGEEYSAFEIALGKILWVSVVSDPEEAGLIEESPNSEVIPEVTSN